MGVGGGRAAAARGRRNLNSLLDTHFLIWVIEASRRLEDHPWLGDYRPWGVSPVSFLEMKFLGEIGRLDLDGQGFADRVGDDPRFVVDEAPLAALVRHALPLDWTRDPFDRLLAAHSASRRVPLCTVDRTIRANHRYLPEEMR
ncbi:MAG: hypothetical protein KY397_03575 [Gemmatimonadetes bacterium]|nr:hypothetical protein [Gemmatimonadota bacterium]